MIERIAPTGVGVALAVATALLLTGCSSEESKGSGKIEGAGQGASEPAPSHSTDQRRVSTAGFDLPKDVTVAVEADTTGDKAKDAVLEGHAKTLMGRLEYLTGRDPKSPAIGRYVDDTARPPLVDQAEQADARNETVTGTFRYYQRKVTSVRKDIAQVTYCEDQSKAFSRNVGTGKVKRTEPSAQDYIAYTEALQRTGGSWRVLTSKSERGAAACQ
ncbi:hypothetical protein ACFYYR_17050 [Streptomyces sp. NPDC001922]|uniref:hypothetical protein n=1 Tax=Streptomyces sp. NPDC001922 TaxID=3364624 RepID=UPI003691604D